MWIIELLFGMLLGGYLFNFMFRHLVNLIIGGIAKKILKRFGYEFPEKVIPAKPYKMTAPKVYNVPAATELPIGKGVHVSDEEMQKWLSENPALRKANEVAK